MALGSAWRERQHMSEPQGGAWPPRTAARRVPATRARSVRCVDEAQRACARPSARAGPRFGARAGSVLTVPRHIRSPLVPAGSEIIALAEGALAPVVRARRNPGRSGRVRTAR